MFVSSIVTDSLPPRSSSKPVVCSSSVPLLRDSPASPQLCVHPPLLPHRLHSLEIFWKEARSLPPPLCHSFSRSCLNCSTAASPLCHLERVSPTFPSGLTGVISTPHPLPLSSHLPPRQPVHGASICISPGAMLSAVLENSARKERQGEHHLCIAGMLLERDLPSGGEWRPEKSSFPARAP